MTDKTVLEVMEAACLNVHSDSQGVWLGTFSDGENFHVCHGTTIKGLCEQFERSLEEENGAKGTGEVER